MRAVCQRVSEARVRVDGEVVGEIGLGWLVLLGVGPNDDEATAARMADKIVGLRVFEDEAGKMNRSVVDVGGSVLLVSQFTNWSGPAREPVARSSPSGRRRHSIRNRARRQPL